jgi:hypothetical protein
MKIKYILPTLLALLTMLVSCSNEEEMGCLDGIQVSKSIVAIPVDGGSTEITIKAAGDWKLERAIPSDLTKNLAKAKTEADREKAQKAIDNYLNWVTVSATSGTAGETVVTFSADAIKGNRSGFYNLVCNGETQILHVIQGAAKVENATCAQVLAGADGKTFRVTGAVTKISNTVYGNWYIKDETGEVYVYGTLDKNGATKNFSSLGLEEGDVVTIEGPKTTYNGTVELVDVAVKNIKKSVLKIDSIDVNGVKNAPIAKEGGYATAHVSSKGNIVSVEIPEDAKSWLTISSVKNNGESTDFVFKASANEKGARSAEVAFSVTVDGKTTTLNGKVSQAGGIEDVTVKEFNAAPKGDNLYRLTGIISGVKNADKGQFYIKDYTGETYIYDLSNFKDKGLKVGDIVTVVGKRDEDKTTIEMTSATLSESKSVEAVSIKDFRSKADSKDAYYMISGKISKSTEAKTNFDLEKYGNFALTDETGTVYVYGVLAGWGGTKGKLKEQGVTLTDGEDITIIATKSTFKGLIEAVGVYVSSKK